jgi:hypothetical protein
MKQFQMRRKKITIKMYEILKFAKQECGVNKRI